MHRFIKKYPEFCAVSLLITLCLFFLFFGLDFYPFLDSQEIFYGLFAKHFIVSYNYKDFFLNLQPILDNPPLYLLFITQTIKIFKFLNEINIKLPGIIISSTFVFFLYYMGKTIVSRKFGFSSAVILLTSLSYLIFSNFAITNIAFIFFVTIALYLVLYSSLKPETSKIKIVLWFLFYLFCGFACLIKGVFGILLPISVVFVYYYFIGKFKDIFNPLFLIPGIICIIGLTMPWYYHMYHIFGIEFIKSLIYITNFKEFCSNTIYLALLFVPAFWPWSIIFSGFILSIIKKLFLRYRNHAKFRAITKEQKVVVFGFAYFLFVFLMTAFTKKNSSDVFFLIPSASILTAYFLCENYVKEAVKSKIITFSTYVLALIFTVSTISFSVFYMFLPLNIFDKFQQFINFVIIGANFISILLLLKLKNKNLFSTLFTYILSMFFILTFTITHGFNMFYLSGENEIVKFSKYLKTKDSKLIVYNLSIKPSVLNETTSNIYFVNKENITDIGKLINNSTGKICYLILKNKDIYFAQKRINPSIYLIEKGEKYSIYSNVNLPKKALSLTVFYND